MDAAIVHFHKRKGNWQICDNHKGTALLNIAGKIFARILHNCLNICLERGLLPESQCNFRRHRGTTEMIFAARQLQEKCQEVRIHFYSTSVDLTKAFDTVNREGLWKIVQKFGCPERLTQMVRQLHDGSMMARITDNLVFSEAFAVTNEMKRGCILAPTLFSLMFSAMKMDAYCDERPGFTSPTGRTVNPSINGGCTSSCVYPQPPSTNFSWPTIALSEQPRKETCKGTWISSPTPITSSGSSSQGENGDYTTTVTQRCLRCTPNRREPRSTASCGHFHLAGYHPLSQRQNSTMK
ncbi:hypothetical protein SprV_0100250900 [Sparganum proliferum]